MPEAPACNCRVCGEEMDRYYQPSIIPGRAAYAFVTCKRDDCEMEGFTLAESEYAALDLGKYLGHRPQTVVVPAQFRAV